MFYSVRSAVAALLLLLFLSSCSFEKRQHLSGYNFEWNGKTKRVAAQTRKDVRKEKIKATSRLETTHVNQPASNSLTASTLEVPVSTKPNHQIVLAGPARKSFAADPCDTVIYRNGDRVKAKVKEITPTEIKYAYCDHPDGPVYSVGRWEIRTIKYANGTTDEFNESKPQNPGSANTPPRPYTGPQETNTLAVVSMILGIASFLVFFLSPVAIVLGAVGLSQIRRNPERYKGAGFASAGIILGSLSLLLLILVLILIFGTLALIF